MLTEVAQVGRWTREMVVQVKLVTVKVEDPSYGISC
jgi:hypothetical protein